MKRFILILMVFTMGIFISGIVPSANAAFKLTLDDTATLGPDIIAIDNVINDINPLVGVVTYSGSIGNWIVNVTTGVSKPIFPNTPNSAAMDLNSVNVSSSNGGTLVIELFDDYVLPITAAGNILHGEIGGTTSGTVDFLKFYESLGTNSVTLGTIHLGPFGPGAFAGSQSVLVPAIGSFSMKDVVTITHGEGINSSSFDAYNEVNPVPEPGTLILIGAGLVGIAGYSKLKLRRRKK